MTRVFAPRPAAIHWFRLLRTPFSERKPFVKGFGGERPYIWRGPLAPLPNANIVISKLRGSEEA